MRANTVNYMYLRFPLIQVKQILNVARTWKYEMIAYEFTFTAHSNEYIVQQQEGEKWSYSQPPPNIRATVKKYLLYLPVNSGPQTRLKCQLLVTY